jgi:hypothetical protein
MRAEAPRLEGNPVTTVPHLEVPQAPATTARSYWLTAPNAADTAPTPHGC